MVQSHGPESWWPSPVRLYFALHGFVLRVFFYWHLPGLSCDFGFWHFDLRGELQAWSAQNFMINDGRANVELTHIPLCSICHLHLASNLVDVHIRPHRLVASSCCAESPGRERIRPPYGRCRMTIYTANARHCLFGRNFHDVADVNIWLNFPTGLASCRELCVDASFPSLGDGVCRSRIGSI